MTPSGGKPKPPTGLPICPKCGGPVNVKSDKSEFNPRTQRWHHHDCMMWGKAFLDRSAKPPV